MPDPDRDPTGCEWGCDLPTFHKGTCIVRPSETEQPPGTAALLPPADPGTNVLTWACDGECGHVCARCGKPVREGFFTVHKGESSYWHEGCA